MGPGAGTVYSSTSDMPPSIHFSPKPTNVKFAWFHKWHPFFQTWYISQRESKQASKKGPKDLAVPSSQRPAQPSPALPSPTPTERSHSSLLLLWRGRPPSPRVAGGRRALQRPPGFQEPDGTRQAHRGTFLPPLATNLWEAKARRQAAAAAAQQVPCRARTRLPLSPRPPPPPPPLPRPTAARGSPSPPPCSPLSWGGPSREGRVTSPLRRRRRKRRRGAAGAAAAAVTVSEEAAEGGGREDLLRQRAKGVGAPATPPLSVGARGTQRVTRQQPLLSGVTSTPVLGQRGARSTPPPAPTPPAHKRFLRDQLQTEDLSDWCLLRVVISHKPPWVLLALTNTRGWGFFFSKWTRQKMGNSLKFSQPTITCAGQSHKQMLRRASSLLRRRFCHPFTLCLLCGIQFLYRFMLN